MTGQNERQDRCLTGQVCDQASHCPLTGRYFQPCECALKLTELWNASLLFDLTHSLLEILPKNAF